jgi:long-chain fatty acid transport protein
MGRSLPWTENRVEDDQSQPIRRPKTDRQSFGRLRFQHSVPRRDLQQCDRLWIGWLLVGHTWFRSRFRLAYRSQIGNTVTGNASFTEIPLPFQPTFHDQGFSGTLDLPVSISGNFFLQLNPSWAAMADITWTNWSTLDEIVINFEDPMTPAAVLPQFWKNSFIYSSGVHYTHGNLTYKLGLARDETPIPSPELRSPRIPDSNRTWVSFCATIRSGEALSFDVGYAHLFMDHRPTNFTDDQAHNPQGTLNLRADIISAQANWKF